MSHAPRENVPSMRQNNFDIVRLILAIIVVFVHSYALSLNPSLALIPRLVSAHVAVEGFFAISGFLIFASYERCASLREYFTNRAFRILPGYWLSTAFCLAIAFSVGSFHVGKFLLANLSFANFLHPGIDGVFSSNPANSFMNGALWTIKIEVMFYISVPIIVWLCRRLNRDAVLWVLFVSSILFRIVFANHEKAIIELPGQLSFFIIGALIYYHLTFFKKHGKWIMLAAAVCFGLHAWTGWFFLRPAAVAALTLGAALLLPQIKGPTRWGDFSYGTYILHYPIVQIVVAAGLFSTHPWAALLLTVCVVAVAATLSWFFIEKPALAHSKSRRLRREALQDIPNYPPAVP
jgi:peptidoglycan/LPS O-acetylase OafA/YrhL